MNNNLIIKLNLVLILICRKQENSKAGGQTYHNEPQQSFEKCNINLKQFAKILENQ